ncbi:hypothetical protein E2C01_004451 [Portunus trituberculatus]|uniref:Uncharacterized protein n=1 Tax=Portunus trituberculatus TaxID=210409 RepID=A0A5B7CU22_PORTR|nr:hypothetical protein [Portunus trituberculatus]
MLIHTYKIVRLGNTGGPLQTFDKHYQSSLCATLVNSGEVLTELRRHHRCGRNGVAADNNISRR